MAGPAVSFSGSPTVSPVTEALCFSEPLPVLSSRLRGSSSTIFLALSQAPPALDMKTARSWPTTIDPARKPRQADGPEQEADEDGREDGQHAGADEFASGRSPVQMSTTRRVVGLLGAGPDLLVAELHAAFLDDEEGGAADGADQHGAEQEGHRAAEEHADEDDRRWRP